MRNLAHDAGSALLVSDHSQTVVRNTSFDHNNCTNCSAALYVQTGEGAGVLLRNVTFAANAPNGQAIQCCLRTLNGGVVYASLADAHFSSQVLDGARACVKA